MSTTLINPDSKIPCKNSNFSSTILITVSHKTEKNTGIAFQRDLKVSMVEVQVITKKSATPETTSRNTSQTVEKNIPNPENKDLTNSTEDSHASLIASQIAIADSLMASHRSMKNSLIGSQY